MILDLFVQLVQYQITLFAKSYQNATIGTIAADFLIAYAILTAGSGRKPLRYELPIVVVLLVVCVWVALQLMDKAGVALGSGQ